MKGNSKWLLGGGLVVTALAAGAVVYGRVRSVDVPRVGAWEAVPLVCAPTIDRVALAGAVRLVREHHHDLRMLPVSDPCVPGDGVISLVVDPALDDQVPAGPIGSMSQDPAVRDGELLPLTPATWGVTTRTQQGTRIVRAHVRLHPHYGGELVLAHELLHALGWEHPSPAPPSGHVLHPHAASLHDWRGVDGRQRPVLP